jgi:glycosyltransferase involved in cell wall biosynthesis
MRVIVNQQAAIGQRTGVGCYAHELLRQLQQLPGGHQIDGFPCSWERHIVKGWSRIRPFFEPKIPDDDHENSSNRLGSRVRRGTIASIRRGGRTFMASRLRGLKKSVGYDIYHETNFVPYDIDCPTVTTIHDLSAILHPDWHPAERVKHFEQSFRRSLPLSGHFLAVSKFTRDEVIRHLGIPASRVSVTYNGIRPELSPLPSETVQPILKSLGLPSQYLLYLGTLEPRKNLLRLLQAYCSLPSTLREKYPLVLVGRWGWKAAAIGAYMRDEGRHRGVIHAGYIPDEHLSAVYNGARALVYPSLYEGFGLPPVEMMACGGAVLTSTAGALEEMFGGQAHLIDPNDTDGWRDAMKRVLVDDDWYHELRRGATARAARYTWTRAAIDTVKVYEDMLNPAQALPKAA